MTRLLLEKVNSNIVESQVPGVEDKLDYYEHKIDKLVRRIDLLETNLNHCLHKWIRVLYVTSY